MEMQSEKGTFLNKASVTTLIVFHFNYLCTRFSRKIIRAEWTGIQ